ncbi:MAG: DUF1573 domain-containing protein [Bacteroidales bacterium]|nr:DUF1573 domain-containing protein [Bacteroidales bacterium]
MKILHAIFSALLCLAFPAAIIAQEEASPMIFDAYECDFGEVEEAGGTLFHTFTFINGASTPIRILRVSASCSCVSVSYPQGRIEGGQPGEISVAFNPARTFGEVERMVDIFLSDGLPGTSLTLKAQVKPSEYDIEDMYPVALPDGVRITGTSLRFGYLAVGNMAERRIDVINASDKHVTIGTESDNALGFLSVACPERLGPGEAGSLILRYSLPDGAASYGMHEDKVTLLVNDRPCNRAIESSCIGVEDFEGRKGPSPTLQVYPSRLEMKRSLLGRGYSGSVVIRNTGSGDLRIRKVDLPDGVTSDLPDGTVLKAGASRKATFRSASAEFSSGLVTNDPVRPYKEIRTTSK